MSDNAVNKLFELLLAKKLKLATAESCTGGLLSASITQKPGASDILERGFITYSNEAKTEMLGVPADMIAQHGAVSAEVAEAMASGALSHSKADLAVSITGIAGPDGGSAEKPVGTVFFGYALKGGSVGSLGEHFKGERKDIQVKAAMTAIKHIISVLEDEA